MHSARSEAVQITQFQIWFRRFTYLFSTHSFSSLVSTRKTFLLIKTNEWSLKSLPLKFALILLDLRGKLLIFNKTYWFALQRNNTDILLKCSRMFFFTSTYQFIWCKICCGWTPILHLGNYFTNYFHVNLPNLATQSLQHEIGASFFYRTVVPQCKF